MVSAEYPWCLLKNPGAYFRVFRSQLCVQLFLHAVIDRPKTSRHRLRQLDFQIDLSIRRQDLQWPLSSWPKRIPPDHPRQ